NQGSAGHRRARGDKTPGVPPRNRRRGLVPPSGLTSRRPLNRFGRSAVCRGHNGAATANETAGRRAHTHFDVGLRFLFWIPFAPQYRTARLNLWVIFSPNIRPEIL